jgi:GH25 family lysozyme M1 (1,4-beta-N-acetylmuramidase)
MIVLNILSEQPVIPSTLFGLVAVISAYIYYYYRNKDKNDVEKIKAMPAAQRPKALNALINDLGIQIPTKDLSAEQRFDLVKKMMRLRTIKWLITSITFIILAIIVAVVLSKSPESSEADQSSPLKKQGKNDSVNSVPHNGGSKPFPITPGGDIKKIAIPKSAAYRPLGFVIYGNTQFLDSSTIAEMRIKFVFIPATAGTRLIGKMCKANVELAKKYGLSYSIYHIFSQKAIVQQQASNFNNAYKLYGSSMPVCLDMVDGPAVDKNGYTDSVRKFISLLNVPRKNEMIIFTSPSFAKDYLDSSFAQYSLALLNYNNNYNMADGVKGIWPHADYWQFNDGSPLLVVSYKM